MTAEVSLAHVLPQRTGSFGVLPAAVATPIAMVLTELLQNAVEHGFSHKSGNVQVIVRRDPDRLEVVVADDGKGLPPDFDLEATGSLGLQIVRTLVVGELSGRLAVERRKGGGTEVILSIPVQPEIRSEAGNPR
jgi:two-component sensor histidine kinase